MYILAHKITTKTWPKKEREKTSRKAKPCIQQTPVILHRSTQGIPAEQILQIIFPNRGELKGKLLITVADAQVVPFIPELLVAKNEHLSFCFK